MRGYYWIRTGLDFFSSSSFSSSSSLAPSACPSARARGWADFHRREMPASELCHKDARRRRRRGAGPHQQDLSAEKKRAANGPSLYSGPSGFERNALHPLGVASIERHTPALQLAFT